MRGQSLFYEKRCEICGKRFYPTEDWVYKICNAPFKTQFYCSWSHYRMGLKMKDRKRGYRRYNGY